MYRVVFFILLQIVHFSCKRLKDFKLRNLHSVYETTLFLNKSVKDILRELSVYIDFNT